MKYVNPYQIAYCRYLRRIHGCPHSCGKGFSLENADVGNWNFAVPDTTGRHNPACAHLRKLCFSRVAAAVNWHDPNKPRSSQICCARISPALIPFPSEYEYTFYKKIPTLLIFLAVGMKTFSSHFLWSVSLRWSRLSSCFATSLYEALEFAAQLRCYFG